MNENERSRMRRAENAKTVKDAFCDAYNFYLKYHGRPMEPGFWDEATGDFSEIMRKNQGSTICGRLMVAVFSQLENEAG